MATLSVTSNSGGDGTVFNDNAGTWATVKGLTTGTVNNADPTNFYASFLSSRSLGRLFVPFDTSALGAGAVVTAATLTINITSILGSNGTVHVVQTTQTDPTSLAAGDFDNISGSSSTMTSGGSAAITSTGSKVITLNATGLSWISTSGYTKLCLVEDHDLTNTDPGASDYRFAMNTGENGTPANRPTLAITYTVSGGGSFLLNFI